MINVAHKLKETNYIEIDVVISLEFINMLV